MGIKSPLADKVQFPSITPPGKASKVVTYFINIGFGPYRPNENISNIVLLLDIRPRLSEGIVAMWGFDRHFFLSKRLSCPV